MSQAKNWQEQTGELRSRMVDVMEEFGRSTPDVPAQIVMAALGELLVQFSVSQAGTANTLHLLEHLRAAVQKFGGQLAPQH